MKRSYNAVEKEKPVDSQKDASMPLKLTKQQKRDVRRNSMYQETTQQVTGAASEELTQSITLTKQQKRDLRRKIKAKSPMQQQRPPNSSVYKRETIYPNPCIGLKYPMDRFVTPKDSIYEQVLATSYDGFLVDNPDKYSDTFHDKFKSSLLSLNRLGYFQYDYTQPFGLNTKIAKTYVTRCLVGDAGITYKYLGLRMFSYPWNKGEVGCTDALAQIKELNDQMITRTQTLLSACGKTQVGSCKYNLTLINKCFKEGDIELKLEPTFNNEPMAVSWHADSSLEHFSSIGIYHFLTNNASNQETKAWRIALRVMNNAEGPTSQKLKLNNSNNNSGAGGTCGMTAPPIAVELPDNGSTERYASTHRVSRTDGHTYESIRTKCIQALQSGYGAAPKQIRSIQITRNDLEFEWIRQFYIQGKEHHDLHTWWKSPMDELVEHWNKLEAVCEFQLNILRDASDMMAFATHPPTDKKRKKQHKRAKDVTLESYDSYLELISECNEKRLGWLEREKSLQHLPAEHRPVAAPLTCDIKSQTRLIEQIKTLRSHFQANLQV